MKVSALVVIDMQNMEMNENTDFLPRRIARFIENQKFDFVLFTKFVNDKNSNLYKMLGYKRGFSIKETDICKELRQFTTRDNVFEKNGYSIFKSKRFVKFLERNRISDLYLCGADTDACVIATAFDAFDLGYNVRVLNRLTASCSGKNAGLDGLRIINRYIQ